MYKNTAALVLQLYYSRHVCLHMDDLAQLECCVSDVARYHNCHPSFIQRLRDRYQAIGTVKDRRRSGQPRMATGVMVKRQLTSIVY